MTTQHGEISCRHLNIYGHGARRRRCAGCGKTWTRWKRKRGRTPRARRTKQLARTFKDKLTLVQQAKRSGVDIETLKKRHRLALQTLLTKSWPVRPPHGQLILLLDGLWFTFLKKRWVVYLMALRSVKRDQAVFLRPLLRPEHESRQQWREVISTLPSGARQRICALVTDSFSGVKGLACSQGWVLQRCHAHLLRRIANVFGRRKRTLKWRRGRERAEALIRTLITARCPDMVARIVRTLQRLSDNPACPYKVRMIIREVVRFQEDFRAYLLHPHLRLPATTNTIESKNNYLREVTKRSHGLRTPGALERWIVAAVHYCPKSKCRPKNLQN